MQKQDELQKGYSKMSIAIENDVHLCAQSVDILFDFVWKSGAKNWVAFVQNDSPMKK